MKKKVAIVGTAGLPSNYGGFETLAQNLVKNLGSRYEFVVYCKKTPRARRQPTFLGARLVYLPFDSNGWQSLLYDIASLFHAFSTADVILYLGPGAGCMLPVNRLFAKNLVVNHGGLNEWERDKLSAIEKRYIFISHMIAARCSTNNVSDNFLLQRNIKQIFREDSVVIRYGGNHTSIPEDDPELQARYPFIREPYFVSVARAQIDNNLHVLIEAFKDMPDKKLVLVSNWSVSIYGRALFEQNQNINNIVLLPAIYDLRHLDYIRSRAAAYIHTHSSCGTAPSLVEAICLGLPIISWDVPTNRETTRERALYFNSKESLQAVISAVTQADLDAVKGALRPLATEEYRWDRICEQYAELFDYKENAATILKHRQRRETEIKSF
jgi:glycosyltransferase involved in cell wall biosynthesis